MPLYVARTWVRNAYALKTMKVPGGSASQVGRPCETTGNCWAQIVRWSNSKSPKGPGAPAPALLVGARSPWTSSLGVALDSFGCVLWSVGLRMQRKSTVQGMIPKTQKVKHQMFTAKGARLKGMAVGVGSQNRTVRKIIFQPHFLWALCQGSGL